MATLTLRPWSSDDLPLLRAANAPAMTAHLNGPESEEEVVARHERYLRLVGNGEALMFVIQGEVGAPPGSIGAWKIDWRHQQAWETEWFVLPERRGEALRSTRWFSSSRNCVHAAPDATASWPSRPSTMPPRTRCADAAGSSWRER